MILVGVCFHVRNLSDTTLAMRNNHSKSLADKDDVISERENIRQSLIKLLTLIGWALEAAFSFMPCVMQA